MKVIIRKRLVGTIPVLEVVQDDMKSKALPLVIYYHGWQINKNLVVTQGRKLANQGFRVILPDAFNHGERLNPVSPLPSLTFFQSIHTNLFEFKYLINYFQERHLTDGFIGVGGLSMGAMTTCALLTHNPEITAAACVMGTPALATYRDRIWELTRERNIFLPEDYRDLTAWIDRYDLAMHADTLGERPLFIWHGDQDEKVPFEQTYDFVQANPTLNLEVEFTHDRHFVDVLTMDKVANFFARQYEVYQAYAVG